LAWLDAALAEARAAYAAAQADGEVRTDRTAIARATRDLRYYAARRASAQLVPPTPNTGRATFGGIATIVRADGRVQTFRIVGDDEADPAKGSISYSSPLAAALLGREAGDVVIVGGAEVEITACG
jgi:transcription elongation GreA/GreB family factor